MFCKTLHLPDAHLANSACSTNIFPLWQLIHEPMWQSRRCGNAFCCVLSAIRLAAVQAAWEAYSNCEKSKTGVDNKANYGG
jgi:hypothetical protein